MRVARFSRGLWLEYRRCLAVGVILLFHSLPTGALAQSTPPPKPSGTVNIHQVQVAFIGSGAIGGEEPCTTMAGVTPSNWGGLAIGGFGVSTIDATGTVYNLRDLGDFEGGYGQARTGWALGQHGKGDMWLQNSNGVYLRVKAPIFDPRSRRHARPAGGLVVSDALPSTSPAGSR